MILLPCIDDDQRAAALRRRLDLPRWRAAELGHEAVRIVREGVYRAPSGLPVHIADLIDRAMAAKRSLPPEAELPVGLGAAGATTVRVAQATSLDAARELLERGHRVLILNFANGVHPGGGYLSGARAQEESLVRCGALIATLDGDPMYAAHARRPTPDSTAWSILSPDVPFFRDEEGTLLEAPWTVSVLTCAAPVATHIGTEIATPLMADRIGRVLDIAHGFGFDGLVLGAWGCGAFGNDPQAVAAQFVDHLQRRDGWFAHVTFAISDWSPDRRFLGPFRDAFDAALPNRRG